MQKVKSRRQQFFIKIRKAERQKIKSQHRKQLHYQKTNSQYLTESWGMSNNLVNNFLNILLQYKQKLLEPFHEVDQKETKNQKVLSINDQTQFWTHYSHSLYQNKQKIDQQLIDFFTEFISKNSQRLIAQNRLYERSIINMLQLITNNDLLNLQLILKWVQGTQTMTIIYNCIPDNFLSVGYFKNVYQIIELVINNPSYEKSMQAVDTIIMILKNSDWDDTYEVYEQCCGLMNGLLIQIRRFSHQYDISRFTDAILYLLDTFDSALVNYARMGVALISAELILSKLESNLQKGLQILRVLTEVAQKDMIEFILHDSDINESGLWIRFGSLQDLHKHRNCSIRKLYHSILFNIISNGQYQQVLTLSRKMRNDKGQDLLDLFEDTLRSEDQPLILQNCLHNIKTLIYYGEQFKGNYENIILSRIVQKQMIKIFQTLQKNSNQNVQEATLIIMEGLKTLFTH